MIQAFLPMTGVQRRSRVAAADTEQEIAMTIPSILTRFPDLRRRQRTTARTTSPRQSACQRVRCVWPCRGGIRDPESNQCL